MIDNSHMADFARCCAALPLLRLQVTPIEGGFEACLVLGEVPCRGSLGVTVDEAVGNALMAAELEGWPLPEA